VFNRSLKIESFGEKIVMEKNKRSRKEVSGPCNSFRPHDEDEEPEEERGEEDDNDYHRNDDKDLSEFETGQIMKVYMQDFMSHVKLTVTFGRKINFISGANGSGH
jgi:hypothetical protein